MENGNAAGLNKSNDKLVGRTEDKVANKNKSSEVLNTELSNMLNAGELYEKRRQYYVETLSNFNEPYPHSASSLARADNKVEQDTVSEIFPERDYDDAPQYNGWVVKNRVPNYFQMFKGCHQIVVNFDRF